MYNTNLRVSDDIDHLSELLMIRKMEREKKKVKLIHSTNSPYPDPQWWVTSSTQGKCAEEES
jgi:hypothetical protein